MSNNVITIREETAQNFLPADMHERGAVDLHELAKLAKAAMQGSDQALKAAEAVADGNAFSRWWNSGEMQKHIIQSISHLGDMSKVNLGLSAICNDLAAANLEYASRIDQNRHSTNQQLTLVQQQIEELLAHLRKPRKSVLLEHLLPALSQTSPADQNEMREWLRTLTKGIDLQYDYLRENLDTLSKRNDYAVELASRFGAEIAELRKSLTNQKAEATEQLDLLTSKLAASVAASDQRADKTDATLRKSHEVLAAALTTMNQQLAQHQTTFQAAIQAEQANREAMIRQREAAIRTTIGELNQHLLKRMLWVASGIVVFQFIGLGFLAFKMGLFK